MHTAITAHLSNTAAKRRDVAQLLLSQLRKVAEKNRAHIIAGDSGTSAFRERGKAKMSCSEEVCDRFC